MAGVSWLFALTTAVFSGLGSGALAQGVVTSPGGSPVPEVTLKAAIAQALSSNPNVLLSASQIEAAKGGLQAQRGRFDLNLGARAGLSLDRFPLNEATRQSYLDDGYSLRSSSYRATSQQLSGTQLLRNGMQAEVVTAQTSTASNLDTISGTPRQGAGSLAFQLTVPLLRNRGGGVSAPLRAAEVEAQATVADLEFVLSQAVLDTTLAYWELSARSQQLVIARGSEERSKRQLEEVRKLIKADQLPKSEISLAEANLNDRRTARISAEQALLESRFRLARAMGLNGQASLDIGDLGDFFPVPTGRTSNLGLGRAEMVSRALESRSDLTAARRRVDAAQILLSAAGDAERPTLDIVLGASQNGISEGRSALVPGSPLNRIAGPGVSANFVFQLPVGNNAARGAFRQLSAQIDGQRVRIVELGYAISNRIDTAASAVTRSAERLAESEAAAKLYATGLENERTKRRLGLATFIDILNIEDRYNSALLAVVQERQSFASALAQLRFEAGTLIQRDGDQYTARVVELLNAEF
jgi:outer membrane protein TolC